MISDRSSEQPGASVDQTMIEAAMAFRQLPLIAFASWCNLMCAPWIAVPSHHAHPDADGQLTVPEPIEETGEHALFA